MITTKITIRPHLAEFLYGKYNNCDFDNPISFSTMDDIYHLTWMLMRKRPENCTPTDTGNVEIALDKNHEGKSRDTYNYLDHESQKIIDLKVEALFYLELHSRVEDNRMEGCPITTIQVIHSFMMDYSIESISEDALYKNDQRHREKTRKRRVRRIYNKSVK